MSLEDKLQELRTELISRFQNASDTRKKELVTNLETEQHKLIKEIDDRLEVSKLLSIDIFELDKVWKGVLEIPEIRTYRENSIRYKAGLNDESLIQLEGKQGDKFDVVILVKKL